MVMAATYSLANDIGNRGCNKASREVKKETTTRTVWLLSCWGSFMRVKGIKSDTCHINVILGGNPEGRRQEP